MRRIGLKLWYAPYRHRLIVIVAGVFYLLACATPSLDMVSTAAPQTHSTDWGYGDLLIGWLGIFVGQFAWFANPFFIAALICIGLRRPRIAAVFALVALLFSIDLVRMTSVPVPADESGSNNMMLHRALIGCYLWYASLIAAFIGAVGLWVSPTSPAPAAK